MASLFPWPEDCPFQWKLPPLPPPAPLLLTSSLVEVKMQSAGIKTLWN